VFLSIQTSNLALFIPNFTPILGIAFQILRQYWELYSKFYASTIVCGIMVQKAKADANTGESEMHPLVL
jgi:hypothetical protein